MIGVRPVVSSGSAGFRRFLLRESLNVLATRSLSEGNKPFVDSRVAFARWLRPGAARQSPRCEHAWRTLEFAQPAGFRRAAAQLASDLPDAPGPHGGFFSIELHDPIDLEQYDDINVFFSPEIGIGDELTFFQFLAGFPTEHTSIWTGVPEIWRRLRFRRVHDYISDPTKLDLYCRSIDDPPSRRSLCVYLGFGGGDFVAAAYAEAGSTDLVHVSLGLQQLRFWRHGRAVQQYRAPIEGANNYTFLLDLRRMAIRCRNAEHTCFALPRSVDRQRAPGQLLLNPLTSKSMVVRAAEWVALVDCIRMQLPWLRRVLVLPGFTEATYGHAAEIVYHLRGLGGIDTSVLLGESGRPFPPEHALGRTLNAIAESELLLGIDTYTAHVAPLFGVPSITLFYDDRQTFRCPGPGAVHLSMTCGLAETLRSIESVYTERALDDPPTAVLEATALLNRWVGSGRATSTEVRHALTVIATSKDPIMRSIGRDRAASIVHSCGRPRVFDLARDVADPRFGERNQLYVAHDWLGHTLARLICRSIGV